MSEPPLHPGSTLTTALLSPVVAGFVRTWDDHGPRTWRVDQPDLLAQMLGSGTIARTAFRDARFREVGLLSATGALLLPNRFQNDEDMQATNFLLSEAATPEATVPQWNEFGRWLSGAARAAAGRGDFLVLEEGGWESRPEPYALFICVPDNDRWVTHLEAAPAPTGERPPWPSPLSSPEGATLSAPTTEETLSVAGNALVAALLEWAASPLDLAVTYGRSPGGIWQPEEPVA